MDPRLTCRLQRRPRSYMGRAVIGVHHRSGQAPAAPPGCRQGVDDELGSHVIDWLRR